MQNFSGMKIHKLQLQQLLPTKEGDDVSTTTTMILTSKELGRLLVQKSVQLPNALHEIFKDLSEHCYKELRTQDILVPRNEKAIATLETNKANDKYIRQVIVQPNTINFGFHDLEKTAAASLTDELQKLRIQCQESCQNLVLQTRIQFRATLEAYDPLDKCIKYASTAWMNLCGGEGETNYYDSNIIITHLMDSTEDQIDRGAGASVSIKIPLSNCLFSIAYHLAGQKRSIDIAEAAAIRTKKEKLQQEIAEKKSAAELAAANRPSADSEAAIRETLKKEIKAELMKELKMLGNQSAVRTSQNVQRGGSANQSTKRGGAAVAGQQPRGGGQQPRGRGRGRGKRDHETQPQTHH